MMQGHRSQATRVDIGKIAYKNGQARADISGFAGERAEGLLMLEPHGFASSPPKGSTGVLLVPGDRRGMGMVMAASHRGHRPDLPDGASALYDAHGNMIKLFSGGATFDFPGKSVTLTGGDWTINGDVTIQGALHVTGDITSDSADGADE